MAWLPDGEQISKISIRFRATHERDRRTPGDGIYRAYAYASRGKNRMMLRSKFSRSTKQALCAWVSFSGAVR